MILNAVQNKVHMETCSYIICETVIFVLVLFNSRTCSKTANHDNELQGWWPDSTSKTVMYHY